MTGTILNVAGIVVGGLAGWLRKRPLSILTQFFLKNALGALTVLFGLRLTWISVNGTWRQVLKQLGIVLLALALGKLAGKLLRLQKGSNRLGRFARERISTAGPGQPARWRNGFSVCSILFCAAPLGIAGAIVDGLTAGSTTSEYVYPLAIKAVMDGVAAMSFVGMFGAGVLWSAVSVLAFQGAITWTCAHWLQPFLREHDLVDPVNATAGLLIFCVALIIFEIKKVEVTDYLPSLAIAPLLTYGLR